MNQIKKIDDTVQSLKKVNGFSKKQAEKFVSWIIEKSNEEVEVFLNKIHDLKSSIKYCACGNICESELCAICSEERDNVVLVVENYQNINKFEQGNLYTGKYFVFDQTLSDNNKEEIDQLISKLVNFAKNADEIIIAISPTLNGEITNYYLKKQLKNYNLKVSQLAIGLPIGSSLDYIDPLTLKQSLINRVK